MSVKSTRHNKDSALNSRKLGICAQNCVETKNVIIVARANWRKSGKQIETSSSYSEVNIKRKKEVRITMSKNKEFP